MPTVAPVALDGQDVLTDWRLLQDDDGVGTPFNTWQWAAALADVPEVCRDIAALRVTEAGRTLGLLAVEHWLRPDGLRVLGLAGGRWLAPDHVDVVARPVDRPAAAHAIARYLTSRAGWDLLDFEGLAPAGALAAALGAAQPPQLVRLPERLVPAPFLDLRPREPALLLPGRNLRQQVTRGLRLAERAGGGGLSVCRQPADVQAALVLLMQLHQQRFGDRSQVFATAARRRFHLVAAARLADAGMARVYRLTSDGQDAALLYTLGLADRLYYYSMGIRPAVGTSPGRTLLGQVALSAAAEGIAEFDLLRGDHAFKGRFASGSRSDLHVRLLRPTPRALLMVGRGRLAARRRAA